MQSESKLARLLTSSGTKLVADTIGVINYAPYILPGLAIKYISKLLGYKPSRT